MTLIKKATGEADYARQVAKIKKQQNLKILANIALQRAQEELCKTGTTK